MNIATLIRFGKGSYDGIWEGNRWFAHGNLVEIAQHYGIGMTVIATEADYEKVCACCDGLIIPGSPIDIDPTYYGADPFDPPNEVDEYALDSKVIAEFDKMRKPMFGICGGHQELNIYFGGTIKKIDNNEAHMHRSTKLHPITITEGSFVHDVFGSTRAVVNCYHNWELGRLGDGLSAVAVTDDGVIEAIENKELAIYATQWHPEVYMDLDDHIERKFFDNFLKKCEEKR